MGVVGGRKGGHAQLIFDSLGIIRPDFGVLLDECGGLSLLFHSS